MILPPGVGHADAVISTKKLATGCGPPAGEEMTAQMTAQVRTTLRLLLQARADRAKPLRLRREVVTRMFLLQRTD
jgi:hypothetical protein